MRRRTIILLSMSMMMGAGALMISAQDNTASPLLPAPAGFTVTNGDQFLSLRQMGMGDFITAARPNVNASGVTDESSLVSLSYGWMKVPGAEQQVESEAQAPEEPEAISGTGIKSEPAGKLRYKGGVLTWRKFTSLMVGGQGASSAASSATYEVNWKAAASGRLLTVKISNIRASKEAGQVWVDVCIAKLTAAASGAD